ncbi:hypothetical protein OA408_02325 [Acidimicrobiaceae bacterium]|nr:hypothetical protein [Acidimicrobiaceae bacterium]
MKLISKNINSDISQKLFYLIVLILFLRIDLVFQNNTPTGGDMGAHIVAIDTFIKDFIPNFQISGWSNDWFAGYPLYYFYFPLPAVITFFLDLIFPFGVAFKLMVVISSILVVYSIEKLISKDLNKFSTIGATAGLFYVLTESFTIYGGNLASTLAGQFSFAYSLAFANLSIFYLIKSNNKFRFPISSIFLSLCLLSHLIPFIIYIPIYGFYWLIKKENMNQKILSITIFLALVSRWFVSLFMNLEFTTNMSYTPFTQLEDLIKEDILPVIFICVALIIAKFKDLIKYKSLNFFELYLVISSILLYFFVPEGALWNGRLVPFFNLGIVFMMFKAIEIFVEDLNLYQQGISILTILFLIGTIYFLYIFYDRWSSNQSYLNLYIPIIFLISVFAILNLKNVEIQINLLLVSIIFSTVSFLPHWLNWNFTGYEGKNDWTQIENLYSKLADLEPGRIMWEPNSDMNKYGTPMTLMTIPYFTEHTSMEGLYFDSSITTPFHFISVSGLAKRPSNPVGGLSYINNQFDQGVEYLNDLGVDYFISYTEEIKTKAINSKKLILLFSSEPFSVFKVNSSKVELIYQDVDIFPKASTQDGILSSIFRDTDIDNFFEKAYESFDELDKKRVIEVSNDISIKSSNKNDLQITDLIIMNDKISFFTDSPGELHLIKVSYFPNWTITNGKGPFRTSPSFMSVIPDNEYVEIIFEKTSVEKNSFYFSLFSLILSLIIFIRLKQNDKKT